MRGRFAVRFKGRKSLGSLIRLCVTEKQQVSDFYAQRGTEGMGEEGTDAGSASGLNFLL